MKYTRQIELHSTGPMKYQTINQIQLTKSCRLLLVIQKVSTIVCPNTLNKIEYPGFIDRPNTTRRHTATLRLEELVHTEWLSLSVITCDHINTRVHMYIARYHRQ